MYMVPSEVIVNCLVKWRRRVLAIDSCLSFVTGHVTFHLLSTTNLHRAADAGVRATNGIVQVTLTTDINAPSSGT